VTPKRPYLLKAFHAWLVDNKETPYLSADAREDIGLVPESAVKDGVVVLNVSPTAIESLDIGLDAMSFYCRFNGVRTSINLPMRSILAIYGKESGQGIVFDKLEYPENPKSVAKEKSKTKLRLV
jgi:stringent starvation protein B